jgi:cation diffusion facilitator CzcD-associated flavoprotein CzcO
MLGIKCLIIDREKRVGDNWRRRYNQLVLHDPVWFDHLPYIPFPENWPVFTPKDKFGDWLESYVRNMELNVWTQTNVVESSWDEATGKWTVTLERIKDETTESRVLHPKVTLLFLYIQ